MEDFRQKIRNGDVEGIQKLVKKDPTIINKLIYEYGQTPLIFASQEGADIRIIDILIKAGPELGAKDRLFGWTALHWAVERNHLQVVELLLSRGSNVNEKSSDGYTPLHLAAGSDPEWTDGVKSIMKQSAVEVNPRDEDGRTPLHLACLWGYLHTVDILLGHNGIDANVVTNDGDTPLHLAVRRPNYKVVCAMLKQDSVQLDIKNHQKVTPLQLAVSEGHLGMVHQLIAKGADVNVVNNDGNNCLHLAVKRRRFHSEVEPLSILDKYLKDLKLGKKERYSDVVVACYLAHHGANFYCKNKIGCTPLDLIEKENLKKTLNMLFPPHHGGGRRMDQALKGPISHGGGRRIDQALKGPIRCVFCEDEVATETFFPCKHLSLCKKCCLPKIPKRCLKCGQNITSKNSLVGPNSSKMEVQMVAGPVVSPKFEDKGVQSDAQLLGATSKQGGSPELKEKDLLRVAKRLGRDWWQVAIFLGVDTTKLKIDDESIDAVKQGYLMLKEWFKNCDPETRTHATLRAALEEAECVAAMECLSLDAK